MNAFLSYSTDVYHHLALESFLTRQQEQDFFFLWRSQPSVVIGKHQNPYKEINLPFALERNIPVSRRISGGGAVYHDLGNINFTFIKTVPEGKQINFKKHSEPVFNALQNLGFDVSMSERNDMRIAGKKFSGNAEHVYKTRVLHHGTILFNSDLEVLNTVLSPSKQHYQDQAIASVRSSVTNLNQFTSEWQSSQDFMSALFYKILADNPEFNLIEYPQKFEKEVLKLKNKQFLDNAWIWGYTPRYQFSTQLLMGDDVISLTILVKKGIIQNLIYEGATTDIQDKLNTLLIGEYHSFQNLKERLKNDFTNQQILDSLF